jgi:hypothetical protein
VLDSEGTEAVAGEDTYFLFRQSTPADPLVGCEGGVQANEDVVLWAENGLGAQRQAKFKNYANGVGLFVRDGGEASVEFCRLPFSLNFTHIDLIIIIIIIVVVVVVVVVAVVVIMIMITSASFIIIIATARVCY